MEADSAPSGSDTTSKNELGGLMAVLWEKILAGQFSKITEEKRTKVEGGWLVKEAQGMTFHADPDYDWDGKPFEQHPIVIKKPDIACGAGKNK